MSYLRTKLTQQDWLDGVYRKGKSKNSLYLAKTALVAFTKFCNLKYSKTVEILVSDLRNSHDDKVYLMLDDFVTYLDTKENSPKTIKQYVSFMRSFLRSQGIKTNQEDFRDYVKLPKEINELRKPLTKEEIRIILDNSKEETKALYLTLLSSGMRVGETLSLKKCDFNLSSDPIKITIPAHLTKTRHGRETYISREARELVLRITNNLDQNDLVFTDIDDASKAVNNEGRTLDYIRKKCNLNKKYSDGKRAQITLHSFRAYCYTIASNIIGVDSAHALLGHSHGTYLHQYYRLTDEQRAELYKKLEPHLLVYSDSVIEEQNRNKRIVELEETVKNLTNQLDEKQNKEANKNLRMVQLENVILKLQSQIETLSANIKTESNPKAKENVKKLKSILKKIKPDLDNFSSIKSEFVRSI